MPATLRCGDRTYALGARTLVMGIVNVTPDSFSDGGRFLAGDAAVAHALRLLGDGADVLDLGGESTRPGALEVAPAEELARVLPVVERLVARGVRRLSIDTRRASVAEACLAAGASWVNDVSALHDDPEMARVASRADAVVLMHRREMQAGEPGDDVRYRDVLGEVHGFLAERVAAAVAAGIAKERILVDPGLGFGKSVEDNLRLLNNAARLRGIAPVLLGPSRKRFLGALTGVEQADERDAATHAAVALAAQAGADVVRVHDVKGAVAVLKVLEAARRVGS
ncbi:MAG: dihydropteroate synthase [Deltaproteobacteria bacterium]|nr:dihydropteroate synthase [Deltaproteobacteria bacterium]